MGVSLCLLDSTLSMRCLVNFHKPTGHGEPSLPLFHEQGRGSKWEKGWFGLYKSSLDLVYTESSQRPSSMEHSHLLSRKAFKGITCQCQPPQPNFLNFEEF